MSYCFKFDDEAAKTFEDITTNNIGRSIEVYLNDKMIANPMIVSAIKGRKYQIGVNPYEEAKLLSESLEKCK